MIPFVAQELAFRSRTVVDLFFLPQLLQDNDIQRIFSVPSSPWNAVFPLCRKCQEREQEQDGLCSYCSAIDRKFQLRQNVYIPNIAIWTSCVESILWNEAWQAWQEEGDVAMFLCPWREITERPGVFLISDCSCGTSLLIITHACRVSKRLHAIMNEWESQSKIASISVFPVKLVEYDKYTTGDLLALADHHHRYFPKGKTCVKFYPKSRYLASLSYAVEREMFWEREHCFQLFIKAREIQQILGKEKIEILRKCLREKELNRSYLFQKLLCLCTREQKEFLLALNLPSLDSKMAIFLLEIVRYVE